MDPSYIIELLKTHDRDRFLLAMLMPEYWREGLLALFAYNHEIAKTRDVVSETQLGFIRLQWWREAIEKIYAGEVLEHEVLQPLARAIEKYDLPQEPFTMLAHAREFDLEDVSPANMEGLLNYCDFTHTPLVRLVMMVLGEESDHDVTQPVAVNYALMGIVRSIAYHAKNRQRFIPDDVMQAHEMRESQLFELRDQEKIQAVAKDMADHYRQNLEPESHFLRYMNGLSDLYWKALKWREFDVFDQRIHHPAFKELRLLTGFV